MNYAIVDMLLEAIPDSNNYTYDEGELVDWYWKSEPQKRYGF